MSVVYSLATKAARMTAVAAAIDAGTGRGRLEIGTTGMALVLVTITLLKPCAVADGATLTFAGFPIADSAADNTGTAAAARLVRSDGVVIVGGLTVGVLAADLLLDDLDVIAGRTVVINSAVLVHA